MGQVQERLGTYRQLLAALLRSQALSAGDIEAAYRQITELAAQVLDVERASVWRLDSLNELRCWDLYERTPHAHSNGQVIFRADAPGYFTAIAEERAIVADDAHIDPRTAEFSRTYLGPLGIGAMLDAPIWAGGRLVGVVCHEHVGGPRRWELDEGLLAATVADFVARVIEAADRLREERALGQYRHHIQELVALRDKQREQLGAVLEREARGWQAARDEQRQTDSTHRFFDGSPVPMVIMRLRDREVRLVNQRGAELFDGGAFDIRAPDFYVDTADGLTFFDELRRARRVDGFVAQLRTRNGRSFWALMSAVRMAYEGDDCILIAFSDVTAQKLAEAAVRESAQSLRTLFAAAPVPLILTHSEDRIVVLANERAADLFEIRLSEIVGERTPGYFVSQEERNAIVQRLLRDGHVEEAAVRMQTRSGRQFWGSLSARVVDFEGERCFLVGLHDVTPQKELEAQLRELATRDPLTGLYNRRHFMELAEHEIVRVGRTQTPLAVCMFDADHFKRINDEYGHAAGDRVLVALARAASSMLRSVDVLGRVGGEEFYALLPDATIVDAANVAERIRCAVHEVAVTADNGAVIRPKVSIGVTGLRPGEHLESLLRRADDALYDAKQQGRDRTVVVE